MGRLNYANSYKYAKSPWNPEELKQKWPEGLPKE